MSERNEAILRKAILTELLDYPGIGLCRDDGMTFRRSLLDDSYIFTLKREIWGRDITYVTLTVDRLLMETNNHYPIIQDVRRVARDMLKGTRYENWVENVKQVDEVIGEENEWGIITP
jgi:hypothetical protein